MTTSDASFCQEQDQLDGFTQNFKSQQPCITALEEESRTHADLVFSEKDNLLAESHYVWLQNNFRVFAVKSFK